MARTRIATLPDSAAEIGRGLIESFTNGSFADDPYPHWTLARVFPETVVDALLALPFEAPAIRESGTREINNDTRQYFSVECRGRHPVAGAVAEAFQRADTVRAIEDVCRVQLAGASLTGTSLRIEYAQDRQGFWLQPHTDIGPKKLSLLIYLSRDQELSAGTDIYRSPEVHCRTMPFRANTALMFVPSDRTWHGFEKKALAGVRKTLIVNYVTREWRARDQLSYPDTPVE